MNASRSLLPSLMLVMLLGPGGADAQAPEGGAGAILPPGAALEVERKLLDEDLREYERMARRRSEAAAAETALREQIDAFVHAPEAGAAGADRLGQLLDRLERSIAERSAASSAEQLLLHRLRERLQRIGLWEEQLAGLAGRTQERRAGLLTGTWDLVLMPYEQRGTAVLHQTGALVAGTYELEGGFSGSLQGTLVNRKVFLQRIDSKLGKFMELEGFLSGDGTIIRGGWLNYELSGSTGATGEWSARRRPAGAPASP